MFDASAGAGLVWFNPKQQKRVSDPPIGDFPCGRNNVVAISILYIYSEIFGEHETKSQLAGETSDKQRQQACSRRSEKCRPRDECRTRSHKRRQDE